MPVWIVKTMLSIIGQCRLSDDNQIGHELALYRYVNPVLPGQLRLKQRPTTGTILANKTKQTVPELARQLIPMPVWIVKTMLSLIGQCRLSDANQIGHELAQYRYVNPVLPGHIRLKQRPTVGTILGNKLKQTVPELARQLVPSRYEMTGCTADHWHDSGKQIKTDRTGIGTLLVPHYFYIGAYNGQSLARFS